MLVDGTGRDLGTLSGDMALLGGLGELPLQLRPPHRIVVALRMKTLKEHSFARGCVFPILSFLSTGVKI